MSNPLVPCPSCSRHIRASEPACPFCKTEREPSPAPARTALPAGVRLTRAAAFVIGASLTVAGCASATNSGDAQADTAPSDDGGPIALYGAAPPPDAQPDTGNGGLRYGAPPPPNDAG